MNHYTASFLNDAEKFLRRTDIEPWQKDAILNIMSKINNGEINYSKYTDPELLVAFKIKDKVFVNQVKGSGFGIVQEINLFTNSPYAVVVANKSTIYADLILLVKPDDHKNSK